MSAARCAAVLRTVDLAAAAAERGDTRVPSVSRWVGASAGSRTRGSSDSRRAGRDAQLATVVRLVEKYC